MKAMGLVLAKAALTIIPPRSPSLRMHRNGGRKSGAFPAFQQGRRRRWLARRPEGIFVAPFEQGEIGPDLFRKACEFGLEGLVSKHRERAYRPGRSPNWVKVKNPAHPAMTRVKDALA